jgi:hypothetical protein
MMTTKIPVHYTQLTLAIKNLIASHGAVTTAVTDVATSHKNALAARRDQLRINRKIQEGTAAHNAAIQAGSSVSSHG